MDPKLQRGFRIGEFEVEPLTGQIRGAGGTRHLEPKVIDVLVFLASRQGELVERDTLLDHVWGRATSEEVLTRCVSELRQALGDFRASPRYIQTIPKRGYRLVEPIVPAAADEPIPSAPTKQAMPVLRALLVDDHEWIRLGIKAQLRELEIDCEDVGSCEEAVEKFAGTGIGFDLILLDYELPGLRGLAAIAQIRESFDAPVIVISAIDAAPTIRQAIAHGAVGYIPKSTSKGEFFAALGVIRAGGIYLPRQILYGGGDPLRESLSERQFFVLKRVLQGKENASIRSELGISDEDLEADLAESYRILGATNRVEAVYEAARRGLRFE